MMIDPSASQRHLLRSTLFEAMVMSMLHCWGYSHWLLKIEFLGKMELGLCWWIWSWVGVVPKFTEESIQYLETKIKDHRKCWRKSFLTSHYAQNTTMLSIIPTSFAALTLLFTYGWLDVRVSIPFSSFFFFLMLDLCTQTNHWLFSVVKKKTEKRDCCLPEISAMCLSGHWRSCEAHAKWPNGLWLQPSIWRPRLWQGTKYTCGYRRTSRVGYTEIYEATKWWVFYCQFGYRHTPTCTLNSAPEALVWCFPCSNFLLWSGACAWKRKSCLWDIWSDSEIDKIPEAQCAENYGWNYLQL